MTKPKKCYSDEVKAEAVRRYMAGESSPKIAADIGCTPCTVMDWVNRSFEHNTKRRDDKMENTTKETPAAAATATDSKTSVDNTKSYTYDYTSERQFCQALLVTIIELADDIIADESTDTEVAGYAGTIKGLATAMRKVIRA